VDIWLRRGAIIVLATLVGAWSIASLFFPYGWDQGCFSYVARVMLHGGEPYRDALDIKGPLVYYTFELLQWVFGRQMWAVRALDLVVLACGGIAAFRIVEPFAGRTAAACTSLMMLIAFASFGNWYTAQPDGWASNLLVVIVALLVTRAPASSGRLAMAAFLVGCCTLLKPTYATYALLVLVAGWPAARSEWARGARSLVPAGVAFAAPIVLAVGWLAVHGVLASLYDAYIRFTMERRATDPSMHLSLARVASLTQGMLTGTPNLAMALPPAALGAAALFKRRPRVAVLLLLWAALGIFSVAAQGKFAIQNYTWHPFYPPLILLAGIGLTELWGNGVSWRNRAPERTLVLLTALLLFKMTSKEPLAHIARFTRLATGKLTLAEYRREFDVNVPALSGSPAKDVGFGVERDIELSDYLDAHTVPSDVVFVWSEPLVNYWSDRDSPTPVSLSMAFTTWGAPARRTRYRADLLEKMDSGKVEYFGAPEKDLVAAPDESNIVTRFPELLSVLESRYDKVTEIGDVELFKRRH
jgi:hypothetical protein